MVKLLMYNAHGVWKNDLDLFQRIYTILHPSSTFIPGTAPPRVPLHPKMDPKGTAGPLVPTRGRSTVQGLFRLFGSCRELTGGAENMHTFHLSGQEIKQHIGTTTRRNSKMIEQNFMCKNLHTHQFVASRKRFGHISTVKGAQAAPLI